jgi:pyruvate,orthophosphate dikinase
VLDSWYSKSTVSFREHMQIADDWGTAVLVQKMILGNRSRDSGTGVVFTSSPYKDYSSINLYGDFVICSQGEDVVSGLVSTLPISEAQRKMQNNDPLSLESAFPDVYRQLYVFAKRLMEQHGFVHQEIEFTFESRKAESLYILQTRNQNIVDKKPPAVFRQSPSEMQTVGHGIGIGSGVLSGRLAFDMEDMEGLTRQSPGISIILARPDTVPDDIPLLFKCDGLITAKGGVTSHAAVTAERLGKVCIVKCRGLLVDEANKRCLLNGREFSAGQPISIDAGLGNIYEGNYEIITQ